MSPVLNAGFQSVVPVTSKVVPRSPFFVYFGFLCKSLQCLISALTQGGEGGHLGSLVQLCCGEGGTLQTNTAGVCGECSQWMDHIMFATVQGSMCFPGLD